MTKPFPLDGGRVGMGVEGGGGQVSEVASYWTGVTPNPGPSPIKGEGRGD